MSIKTPFLVLLLGLLGGTAAAADVVLEWNSAALDAIRSHGTPPTAAARHLAMLHVAIYDAMNGIRPTHDAYLVDGPAPRGASVDAAASAAARDVLADLYPDGEPAFDRLHAQLVGHIPSTPYKRRGLEWGERVAAEILAARANDGSDAVSEWPLSDAVGEWRPTPSFGGQVLPALAPLWGSVVPFGIESVSQFLAPPPPALVSAEYAEDLNEVKALGSIASTARTTEQTEIALFWGYGPRTATPPGHWNQIAQAVAAGAGNTPAENARLFALLNIALADAAIACWEAKYTYAYWRPITAIHLADQDGNPATSPDTGWAALLETPPFPEYPSGHSTFSGAAAVTLAQFFGRDDVAFAVGSDDLLGVYRFYGGFWEAARESGASRIYGGIHFGTANVNGLQVGAQIGMYVSQHLLRPLRGRERARRRAHRKGRDDG